MRSSLMNWLRHKSNNKCLQMGQNGGQDWHNAAASSKEHLESPGSGGG